MGMEIEEECERHMDLILEGLTTPLPPEWEFNEENGQPIYYNTRTG